MIKTTLKKQEASHATPLPKEQKLDRMEASGKLEEMRPILAKRTINRTYRDAFDKVVSHEVLKRPCKATRAKIRKALKMKTGALFPKCASRDYHKAELQDRKDGISLEDIRAGKGFHTKQGHVCSICRCTNTAGRGSRGWWYWAPDSGLPEAGHYGVGPCFLHGPSYSTRMGGTQLDQYRRNILNEIEAMQNVGAAPDGHGGYLVDMRQQAEMAKQRQSTRTVLHALYKLADETVTALRKHRETPKAEQKFIKEICSIFGLPEDMLEDKDRSRLLELSMRRPMTEWIYGNLRAMSDKTSIELERGLLKDVGQAAKLAFDTHEDQYMHEDQVLLLLERLYSEADMHLRASASEEDWAKFMGGAKDICRGFADRSIDV